ncbi:MAG: ribosome small subunit-dependent GTPase A [Oscillospiraceae bacterium]|nr:ribosome small subunit-dependent GTPase A [Oscillospiraceae bacterium]
MDGRILKALGGFYYVELPDGIMMECKARGRLRLGNQSPLVGDKVKLSAVDGTIESILPRKNCFVRPAVANVDLLVIFASGAIPVTEPFLIDRICAVAALQDVPVAICINKCDLDRGQKLLHIYRAAGYRTIPTSAETGEGIDELAALLPGKLSVFTGNSGVGKSSVLNRLDAALDIKVGDVSLKLGRGRHTTRHVELYHLKNGGLAADTPGFSAFDTEQAAQLRAEQLAGAFPDFSPYLHRCRFPDCAHRKEPGCALRAAVEAGDVQQSRYESYLRLYEKAMEYKPYL